MIETRIAVSNIEEISNRLGNLSHRTPSVIANAINRTTTNIKANMAKQTTARYNIASGEAKKTINVTKATKGRLEGRTISKASPIALAKFRVSPNRPVTYSKGKPSPKVYKVSVEKGPASKALDAGPKAFIAIMKSGHQGIFRRISNASLPLKQLYGPSVPQMIQNKQSMKKIEEDARDTLQKRIDAEINNILRKG